MAKRVRAYIGLGANVGDARANLADAVRALAALPGARLRAASRLYRTKPVGVTDQPDFLNAVIALDVPAGPDPETGALALLAALKLLEGAIGHLQLWTIAYSHDVFGYMPSARTLKEGGYECRGLYTTTGFFEPSAQDVLVAKVRELALRAGRKID